MKLISAEGCTPPQNWEKHPIQDNNHPPPTSYKKSTGGHPYLPTSLKLSSTGGIGFSRRLETLLRDLEDPVCDFQCLTNKWFRIGRFSGKLGGRIAVLVQKYFA